MILKSLKYPSVPMSTYRPIVPAFDVPFRVLTMKDGYLVRCSSTAQRASSTRLTIARGTVDRNPTGFRFLVDGNGVLLINEGGYQRPSSATAPLAWFRAGYMRNSTRYLNRDTGVRESGNDCAYVLMDYQLRMPDRSMPSRGLFLGGTAMTVPSVFNPYDRYYEARVYQRGTFSSRPTDVLSTIAGYRNHSRFFTNPLAAQGKTVWRNSPSFTGPYTLHVSPGDYLSLSLGYARGPAISPRVPAALVFTANWGLYL